MPPLSTTSSLDSTSNHVRSTIEEQPDSKKARNDDNVQSTSLLTFVHLSETIPDQPKKTVLERLKRNLKDAREQQEAEKTFRMFAYLQGKGPRFRIDDYDDIGEIRLASQIFPIESKEFVVNEKLVGMTSCQGFRQSMEDKDIATQLTISVGEEKVSVDLFGIFDGHKGGEVSLYAKEYISYYLEQSLKEHNSTELTVEGIFNSLKDCFILMDLFCPYKIGGTTATAVICIKDNVWVANVGDSRALFVNRNGEVIQTTEDAKPYMPSYQKKILRAGGLIKNQLWIVSGTQRLSVARAIGDKNIVGMGGQCCVSPNPKLTCLPLKDVLGGYFVIACDGLFEPETSLTQAVGTEVHRMARKSVSPGVMSRLLVKKAIECGSTDNVTCLVIKF